MSLSVGPSGDVGKKGDAAKKVDVVKKGSEEVHELSFDESNLGKMVAGAKEAQRDPKALADRLKNRPKRKPDGDPDKDLLQENADRLASAGRDIEVKTDSAGNQTVSMKLDLAKMRDFSLFTPDVKEFNLRLGRKGPDGVEKFDDEKVVFRQTVNGKIGYFYIDDLGDSHDLELPPDGTAQLTIHPSQYDNKSQEEVLHLMRREMAKAAGKLVRDDVKDDVSGSLVGGGGGKVAIPDADSGLGGGGGGRGRSPAVDSGADYDPGRSALKGKVGSVDLRMPETVKGPLDTVNEALKSSESPIGLPMTINYSKNPELAAKEPCYIYAFHGDGGSMGAYLSEAMGEVDALRKAGINAILVVPEYDTGKSMDNRWRYLDGKCDAMFDFVSAKFKQGKINLTSFSGGYRAVASILANSKHRAEIGTISMLDSTYPDSNDPVNKLLAQFVRDGGNVKAFTGLGAKTVAGVNAIKAELAKNPGTGTFEHIDTNLSHGRVNKDYLQAAMAFAGNVKLEEIKTPKPDHEHDDHDHDVLTAGSRILKYPIGEAAKRLMAAFNPKEALVAFQDAIKGSFKLRETTYKCFQLAREFAKEKGFDIQVTSAHRTRAHQAELYRKSTKKGLMVAAPGRSNHQSGAAVDCCLVDANGKRVATREGKDFLERCMNRAGFVRYSVEWWHFELGSKSWSDVISKDERWLEMLDLIQRTWGNLS